MKILCIYCSAEKQTVVGNVPAISRYISKRIDWVAEQSFEHAGKAIYRLRIMR